MLRRLKEKRGFTLVEIMIVVGIVILLGGLSIHGLLRVRIIANEAAAMKSLRAMQTAMDSYKTMNLQFPAANQVLNALTTTNPPYLDNSWQPIGDGTSTQRQGYTITVSSVSTDGQYLLRAQPVQQGVTGERVFVLSQLQDLGFPPSGEIYDVGMETLDLTVPGESIVGPPVILGDPP